MDRLKKTYDVVVIGSGFGGSVSALRLAEKGYKVLVLEKGKRYKTKDFPKTNWNLRKYLWFPKLFMYGIQCITLLKNVFVLHGAGVGGGSLVYANTLLIPRDKVFDDQRWPQDNWKSRLFPYYEKAKHMLGVTPSKHLGDSDFLIKEVSQEMGREDTFSEVNVGVYFGKPHSLVYSLSFKLLGIESRARVLAVGDGLATDIKGASAAGIDSLLVTGGLLAEELGTSHHETPAADVLAAVCDASKIRPRAAISALRW